MKISQSLKTWVDQEERDMADDSKLYEKQALDKKRQREQSDYEEQENTSIRKKKCTHELTSSGKDKDEKKEEEQPWLKLSAASTTDNGDQDDEEKCFKLCTVTDMPQPKDGFIFIVWVEQSSSMGRPDSHQRYMIPTEEVNEIEWEKLVTANNVIAAPLEPLEEYSKKDRDVLCPLLTHAFEDTKDPFISAFLKRMKMYKLPMESIPNMKLVREIVITGALYE